MTVSAFDLPDRLAAKADPALIAGDEEHFADIAESLEIVAAKAFACMIAVITLISARDCFAQAYTLMGRFGNIGSGPEIGRAHV